MPFISFNNTYKSTYNNSRPYQTQNVNNSVNSGFNVTALNNMVIQLLSQLLQQFTHNAATSQFTSNNSQNNTISTSHPNTSSNTTTTPNTDSNSATPNQTSNTVNTELRGTLDPAGALGTPGEPGYRNFSMSNAQVNVIDKMFDFMNYKRFGGMLLDVNQDGVLSAGDQVRTQNQDGSGMFNQESRWKHTLSEAEVSAIKGDFGALVDVARGVGDGNETPLTQTLKELYPEQMRSKEVTGFFDSNHDGQLSEGDIILARKAMWLTTLNNVDATEVFIKATSADMARINGDLPNTIAKA